MHFGSPSAENKYAFQELFRSSWALWLFETLTTYPVKLGKSRIRVPGMHVEQKREVVQLI